MGVGLEMIFFLGLLVVGAYLIYRVAFKGRRRLQADDFKGPRATTRRWATIAAGVLLVIVIALTLEFCREQQHRMEKNTHENNAQDNIGKGENEDDNRDDGNDTQR
ncbi:hypothetical protein ACFPMF_03395 [Larkinella bovis]|uniref:Uncharacterized protein n=1 Tax=Larkinella bovis TaxID=683041 RepID=A0ABW0IAK2_9BACT